MLEPRKVFSFFKAISDIPRGSGNEAAVAKFVYDTATAAGHHAVIDSANNVFVSAAATCGYEAHEPIMLQGHLDMVCEANRAVQHDFLTDPIKLVLDGDILHADGTTLGADDGVAVAIMLAILTSDDVPHPALECLFTTEEETGLTGMRTFDPAALGMKSRRLINLDSAGEGMATVSCAGGVRSHVYFKKRQSELRDEQYSTLNVSIGGLFGGHSGEDINLGRLGAVAAFARIMYSAMKVCDVRISDISGGSRDNAIPRECSANAAVADKDAFIAAVRAEEEKLRHELVSDDAGFTVKITENDCNSFLSSDDSQKLINLLRVLPNGVKNMCMEIPGLVETSSNVGVIRENENSIEIVVSSRSSVSSRLDDLQALIESAAALTGASVEHIGRYPGWDFVSGSPMQTLYLETYKKLFNAPAEIIGIHAGLECGLLKGKVPDMDMISIGPDVRHLHSPDERLSVSSLARLYLLTCTMLKNA